MLKRITAYLISFQIILFSGSYAPLALATDAPNKEELKNAIQQQVTQGIQDANASSNTQPSTPAAPVTPQPVNAQNSETVNTGDNNAVSAATNDTTTTGINNQNDATVNQNVTGKAVTGNNDASRNISFGGNAGIIETGDASVNTSAKVNANTNSSSVMNENNGTDGNGATIYNSGDDNAFNSEENKQTTIVLGNGNTTTINQVVDAEAVTGNNTADRNIAIGNGAAGVIKTGNASVNTNYVITANGNVALVGGKNNGNGAGSGASIYIANTGNFATASMKNNMSVFTLLDNRNSLHVSQTCGQDQQRGLLDRLVNEQSGNCEAVTGYNTSNRGIAMNGSVGVIQTGDAVVNIGLAVSGNENTSAVENGGTGTGTDSTVVNTGDNSQFGTESNSDQTTLINNTNSAAIDQNINAKAITGYNTANRNIAFNGDAGVIKTGSATINVNLDADVNSNSATVSDPGATSLGGPANNSTFINSGDHNTMNTVSNTSLTTILNNYNILNFIQNVKASAITGGNSAVRNIGAIAGVIETGNADVTINADVTANTNVADPYVENGGGSIPTPETTPTPGVGGPSYPPVAEIAGTASSSNGSSVGQVLGAMTASLPATGPELLVANLAGAIVLLGVGMKLRKSN